LIELRDVTVKRRPRRIRGQRRHLLDRLSVRVDDGEVVALVGKQGFGGTTIARLVAGVGTPDSGVIMVDDFDITDKPAERRPVGLIPAGGGLLPHLTAKDNITYGLRLLGMPNMIIRHRLAAVAKRLELEPSLQLRPDKLPAGQRIRVALARALVRSVPIRALAVDATAGSDGLAELRDIIKLALPNSAMPILLCTRDPAVFSWADRVIVIDDGQAGRSGPPEQLTAEPPDLATARILLQPMADIPGVVRDGYIDCGAFRLPAPAELRQDQNRRVLVALTVDDIELVADGHGIPAKVVTVEQAGVAFHVLVEVLVEPAVRSAIRCTVTWTSSSPPRVGDRVGIRTTTERFLVFDAEVHPRLTPRASGWVG
jgi:ABC-type sugar transport system ATPase subunit